MELEQCFDLLQMAAERVHEQLGIGYSEAVYRNALSYELSTSGVMHGIEVPVSILYRGMPVGAGRVDLLVTFDDPSGDRVFVAVELKAAKSVPGAARQMQNYVRDLNLLYGARTAGLLVKFPVGEDEPVVFLRHSEGF
jgi:GxxExxY protein